MIRICCTGGPGPGRAKNFWGTRVLLFDSGWIPPYRAGSDFRSM